jgi:hypothetical protein
MFFAHRTALARPGHPRAELQSPHGASCGAASGRTPGYRAAARAPGHYVYEDAPRSRECRISDSPDLGSSVASPLRARTGRRAALLPGKDPQQRLTAAETGTVLGGKLRRWDPIRRLGVSRRLLVSAGLLACQGFTLRGLVRCRDLRLFRDDSSSKKPPCQPGAVRFAFSSRSRIVRHWLVPPSRLSDG